MTVGGMAAPCFMVADYKKVERLRCVFRETGSRSRVLWESAPFEIAALPVPPTTTPAALKTLKRNARKRQPVPNVTVTTWYATPKRYSAGTVFKIDINLAADDYPPILAALLNAHDQKRKVPPLKLQLAAAKSYCATTEDAAAAAKAEYDAAVAKRQKAATDLEHYMRLVEKAQAALDAAKATFAQA